MWVGWTVLLVLAGLGHVPGTQLAVSWSRTAWAPTTEMTGIRGPCVSSSSKLARACSSWLWLGWKSGNRNTQGLFLASVWITFANIPLAKDTHMGKPRIKEQRNNFYLLSERNFQIVWQRSLDMGGGEKLELLIQLIQCVMATNSRTCVTGYILPQQDLPRIFLILITDPKEWITKEASQITAKKWQFCLQVNHV